MAYPASSGVIMQVSPCQPRSSSLATPKAIGSGGMERSVALPDRSCRYLRFRSRAYSSDLQWHGDRQNGGAPWEAVETIEKFSPVNYAMQWKKPILVTHGGRDFRAPFDQGLSTFTLAQRRGMPSELLYLPGENHTIVGSAASILWYDRVDTWLDRAASRLLKGWMRTGRPSRAPLPARDIRGQKAPARILRGVPIILADWRTPSFPSFQSPLFM